MHSLLGTAVMAVPILLCAGCGLRFTPLPQNLPVISGAHSGSASADSAAFLDIFDEDVRNGGFPSGWPLTCKITPVDGVSRAGDVSLLVDLDPNDWSSAGIGWEGEGVDLSSVYASGCLEFWVKGADGAEIGTLGLSDNGESGNQCGVSVKIAYFGITKEWQHVRIPLTRFGTRGTWWDMAARTDRPCEFNWSAVKKVRFSAPLGGNRRFRIWIDDMRILPTIPGKKRAIEQAEDENVAFTVFREDFPEGTTNSGWPMSCLIMTRDNVGLDSSAGAQVDMAVDDWANTGVRWPTPVDVSAHYETGCLQLRIRGSAGREEANLSLGCLGSNGLPVAKGLPLSRFVTISKEWQTVTIPFREFGKKGNYWDEERKVEVEHDFDWSKVVRFGFSTSPNANQTFRVWLDDVFFLKTTPETKTVASANGWDDGPRFIATAPEQQKSPGTVKIFYDGAPGPDVQCIGKGGRTHPRFFRSDADKTYGLTVYQHILAAYFDRNENGAVTLISQSSDDSSLVAETSNIRLEFWARSPENGVYSVGLVDRNGKIVGVLLDLAPPGGIGEEWKRFALPLSRFQVSGPCSGVAFGMQKTPGQENTGSPTVLYLDHVILVRD